MGLRSMTGFGRSALKSPHGTLRVEIKTTNHKFLEVSTRLPIHLSEQDDFTRKLVAKRLNRGKVAVFVQSADPATYSTRLVLNEGLAREVHSKIRRLKDILKIKSADASDAALLGEVIRYPDVLRKDSSASMNTDSSKWLGRAVTLALVSLDASKALEGRALAADLKKRIVEIRRFLKVIEKRIPVVAKVYKKSLESRIKDFVREGKIDRERLTIEVAQYVKNSDISEEVTRLKSHLHGMGLALGESGETGRKIDFIAQEMHRETNTMGSKSQDTAIAAAVIAIKSAIEKIREQAQNVE